MGTRGTDRRVRRTRQQLTEALLALIREKGYEALTVQDIIDRADVGRSTFYAHYSGKADLLIQGLGELQETMRELQRRAAPPVDGAPAFAFVDELLAHTNEQRDVFRAMVGKHSGVVLQRRFQGMIVELLREELGAVPPSRSAEDARSEALAQFLASGLYGLMAWWLDAAPRLSAAEVSALFRRLAQAALAGAPTRTTGSP